MIISSIYRKNYWNTPTRSPTTADRRCPCGMSTVSWTWTTCGCWTGQLPSLANVWPPTGARSSSNSLWIKKREKPLRNRWAATVPLWRHNMETFSSLLAFCETKTPVTGGFPAKRTGNGWPWCILRCQLGQAVEQTLELPVIWIAISHMWRPLKRKYLHFDATFITCCSGSYQNDKFRCSQWSKFRQNDIFLSVSL